MNKTVVELFAGVGGFRVGMNNVKLDNDGVTKEKKKFNFVWSNQWEPSTKVQHAFSCYEQRFGNSKSHVNEDISIIDKNSIPNHTLLVGGFPCQDYSVARTLSKEKGIAGKKGVLWWEIYKTLEAKKPPFVLLENVDRLLKSPSTQRGRDFGIMLRTLNDLGYGVEWRIINAAEYGYAQRRRRVFIFAYNETTQYYKDSELFTPSETLSLNSMFAKTFPVLELNPGLIKTISLKKHKDLVDLSENFDFNFENSGYSLNHTVYTAKLLPVAKTPALLSDIINKGPVENHYYLDDDQIDKFKYLRGSKKIERINKETGGKYFYTEGAMSFPDSLDLPGRTMLTSEGSINRSTHIILDPYNDRMRLLTPNETERLNGFPSGWTDTGMPEKRRYFMMGNALVCGVVSDLSETISSIIDYETKMGN